MWRYINNIDSEKPVAITDYQAVTIKSIYTVDQLVEKPSNYVPISELLHLSTDLNTQAKLDNVAKTYLMQRASLKDTIFVSYKLSADYKGSPVAHVFMSPVIPGPDSVIQISSTAFIMAYFDVFTNLRVANNWFLANKFQQEIQDGCLDGIDAECSLLLTARALYRVSTKLAQLPNVDVSKIVCEEADSLITLGRNRKNP